MSADKSKPLGSHMVGWEYLVQSITPLGYWVDLRVRKVYLYCVLRQLNLGAPMRAGLKPWV